ncbi:MAG TPA: hypothetical protein VFB12_20535 [Ktedonobacteraceae bacterium]|nr:hypothetical protein [Ktedonobacteraceae bacterium]
MTSFLLDPAIPLPFVNGQTLIGREELLAETRELVCGQRTCGSHWPAWRGQNNAGSGAGERFCS